MNGPAFMAEEHVAVTAHAGVARPLVAGQTDEAPWRIEGCGQAIELLPKRVGDLEVVALMSDDVDERLVACVAEITLGGAGANGFTTLAMQITPIVPQECRFADPQGIGACKHVPGLAYYAELHVARRFRDEVIEYDWTVSPLKRHTFRQSANRSRRHEGKTLICV